MDTVLLIGGLVAVFAALLLLVLVLGGWTGKRETSGRKLRRRLGNGAASAPDRTTSSSGSTVARNAVDLAGRVTSRADLDLTLSRKLGAAGLSWSPGEWLLLHTGIAVAAGLVTALLTGFRVAPTVLAVAVGVLAPFLYLSIKESRRRAAFQSGLADMLQLMSGSLSAGYSVPQAFDTVARESKGPIAEELDRALLQARVGVPLEDALEAVAERMRSVDFAWVVMSIRVQREIGGNLAEVLTNVAETLRQRDRIRRQVNVLSSEGRLSAWVLGGLPVAFGAWMIVTQPDYIGLLVTTPLGLSMLLVALILFVIGVFWLTRIVKVEV